MSYARRDVTEHSPAIQAAREKLGAQLRWVREKRLAGEYHEATREETEAQNRMIQKMREADANRGRCCEHCGKALTEK